MQQIEAKFQELSVRSSGPSFSDRVNAYLFELQATVVRLVGTCKSNPSSSQELIRKDTLQLQLAGTDFRHICCQVFADFCSRKLSDQRSDFAQLVTLFDNEFKQCLTTLHLFLNGTVDVAQVDADLAKVVRATKVVIKFLRNQEIYVPKTSSQQDARTDTASKQKTDAARRSRCEKGSIASKAEEIVGSVKAFMKILQEEGEEGFDPEDVAEALNELSRMATEFSSLGKSGFELAALESRKPLASAIFGKIEMLVARLELIRQSDPTLLRSCNQLAEVFYRLIELVKEALILYEM